MNNGPHARRKPGLRVALQAAAAIGLLPALAFPAEREEFHLQPLREDTASFSNRADVVQFIDETETALGEAVSLIAWRELFGSIQDLPSSGTKLLTIDDDPDLQKKIVDLYKYDVARIAEEQRADFVVWGVVREIEQCCVLWTYLAVSDDRVGPALEVHVGIGPDERYRLSARLPKKQFNFTPLMIDPGSIGERRWFVRRDGANVFSKPDSGAERIEVLPKKTFFDSQGIVGKWVRFEGGPNEGQRFVEPWSLDLLPSQAILRNGVVRQEPDYASSSTSVGGRDLPARVVGQEYVGASDVKWYRVDVEGRTGWVPAEGVVANQTLPVGYLLAAMLRYQGGDYELAIDEVDQFMSDGRERDNAILAFANELRAAAATMAAQSAGRHLDDARAWIDEAVRLTPYDPAAYRLSALAYAASGGDWRRVMQDLESALRLDRRSEETRAIIEGLIAAVEDDDIRMMFRPEMSGVPVDAIHGRLLAMRKQALPAIKRAAGTASGTGTR